MSIARSVQSAIKKILPPSIRRLGRKTIRKLRSPPAAGSMYLASYGWRDSHIQQRPIDQFNNPIPWFTYPALSVLRKVVSRDHRVFEYGCGNSSLWWAAHAHSVISVDHDAAWSREISDQAPSNLTVLLKAADNSGGDTDLVRDFFVRNPDLPTTGNTHLDTEHGLSCLNFKSYAAEVTKYEPFDIIVVDGMARSLCAWMAGNRLKPDGFIVFDNSDRWQYNPGYKALSDLGFGRVDFVGLGPINAGPWCTSIFFRSNKWSKPLILADPNIKADLDWIVHFNRQA